MRRRKLKPDTRPHWDDPDLKVRFGGIEMTAEEYSKFCQEELETNRQYIYYKDDPTYNLKKKS